MTKEEYQHAVLSCVLAAKMLVVYDIPKLIEAIDRADAVGPILDPTLWREKHRAMDEDRQIIEAALPLWKVGDLHWRLGPRRLHAPLSRMPALDRSGSVLTDGRCCDRPEGNVGGLDRRG